MANVDLVIRRILIIKRIHVHVFPSCANVWLLMCMVKVDALDFNPCNDEMAAGLQETLDSRV